MYSFLKFSRSLNLILFIALFSGNLNAQSENILYLKGATIYASPESDPIPGGVVKIEHGIIKAIGPAKKIPIPKNATVLDCKGFIMTAGFWNSHVHFLESKWDNAASLPAKQLQQQFDDMLTSFGFTYVFDAGTLFMDNVLALRKRVQSGEVRGPEILIAGVPFVPRDGSPFYLAPLKLPEIYSPEEAVDYVKSQVAEGSDAIKIFTASPTNGGIQYMDDEIIKQAAVTAHESGKLIAAHPTNNKGAMNAINAGVDILVHTSPDENTIWNDTIIKKMLRNKMALIPTLKLFKWELEKENIPATGNVLLTTAKGQLGAFSKAGGEILFGTDVGYMTEYSPSDEYQLMAESGMNFRQILASLTTNPAKRFKRSGYSGRLEPGAVADIVLLKKDPEMDIRNLAEVVITIQKGKIVYSRQ